MAVKPPDPNHSNFVRLLRWMMRGRGSQIKAMEDALRMMLHLLMSQPEYQLG